MPKGVKHMRTSPHLSIYQFCSDAIRLFTFYDLHWDHHCRIYCLRGTEKYAYVPHILALSNIHSGEYNHSIISYPIYQIRFFIIFIVFLPYFVLNLRIRGIRVKTIRGGSVLHFKKDSRTDDGSTSTSAGENVRVVVLS